MIKRILVTGAAGFIGSTLSDSLVDSGIEIMGIDNFDTFYDRSVKERNIANSLNHKLYKFREGDIRDPVFIIKSLEDFKPEIVVHLAAKAGVRESLLFPEVYFDVNVMGTLNILEAMKKTGVRKMLFASSSSVYGNNKELPFSETQNVDNPISQYAASKKAGELLCYTYHELYNMDIFCLRFFTVYGPRQRPDLAIYKFTKAILSDQLISIYGDGTTSRDYTYIDDIVSGINLAIAKVKGYNIINLGESYSITLERLISLLEECTGKKARTKILPLPKGDVFQTFADIERARTILGYNPTMDLKSGLKNFIKWYKNQVSELNHFN